MLLKSPQKTFLQRLIRSWVLDFSHLLGKGCIEKSIPIPSLTLNLCLLVLYTYAVSHDLPFWCSLSYCMSPSGLCVHRDTSVQKRYRRTLLGVECIHYTERLDTSGLFSLEHWSPMKDLVEVYKIRSGKDREDRTFFLARVKMSRIMGHNFKLAEGMFKRDVRESFLHIERWMPGTDFHGWSWKQIW